MFQYNCIACLAVMRDITNLQGEIFFMNFTKSANFDKANRHFAMDS